MSLSLAGPMLQKVLDNPDEDGPRILFADWLEENGATDYAEFIRVQLMLANDSCASGVCVCTKRCDDLRRRERELLDTRVPFRNSTAAAGFAWCPDVVRNHHDWNYQNGPFGPPVFTRGFVSEIACSWSDWSSFGIAICKTTPLRKVCLTHWTNRAGSVPVLNLNQQFLGWCKSEFPGIEFEFLYRAAMIHYTPSRRDIASVIVEGSRLGHTLTLTRGMGVRNETAVEPNGARLM